MKLIHAISLSLTQLQTAAAVPFRGSTDSSQTPCNVVYVLPRTREQPWFFESSSTEMRCFLEIDYWILLEACYMCLIIFINIICLYYVIAFSWLLVLTWAPHGFLLCMRVCLFFVVRLLLKWTPEVVYCIMDLLLGSVLDHATWNPLHTAHILCLEGEFERWKHGMGIYIVPRNLFLDRLFCNMSLRIIPGIKSETMWRWTSLRKGPW